MQLMSIGELLSTIEDSGEEATRWGELYHKAIEEIRSGACIRMGMVVAVGQKMASSLSSPT